MSISDLRRRPDQRSAHLIATEAAQRLLSDN